jgi:hypothetical protein
MGIILFTPEISAAPFCRQAVLEKSTPARFSLHSVRHGSRGKVPTIVQAKKQTHRPNDCKAQPSDLLRLKLH